MKLEDLKIISDYQEGEAIKRNSIIKGDCLEIMKGIKDKSVDMKRIFTEEHKTKISNSRKKLKADGWRPYNVGLKTIDRKNGKELLFKNMKAHLKYNVTLEWLMQFQDIERVKYLNRAISRKRDSNGFTDDIYMKYIEKFYNDDKFIYLFDQWIKTNDKWIKPSLDHIVAKSNGGGLDINNLQFISWLENRTKVDIPLAEWNKIKKNIRYYL